jgi:hypothetical protein
MKKGALEPSQDQIISIIPGARTASVMNNESTTFLYLCCYIPSECFSH